MLQLLDDGEFLEELEVDWPEVHLDKSLFHDVPHLSVCSHMLVSISETEDVLLM